MTENKQYNLINSRILEKNNISLILFLYSINKNQHQEFYILSDYIGYGLNDKEKIKKYREYSKNKIKKLHHINDFKNNLEKNSCGYYINDYSLGEVLCFIDNMTFEDVLKLTLH